MKGKKLKRFLTDDNGLPTRWPEHQGVSESAGTYAEGWNAALDAIAEAIARMADERSKRWVAYGVEMAVGQGDPFPAFAAEIRKRFGDRK